MHIATNIDREFFMVGRSAQSIKEAYLTLLCKVVHQVEADLGTDKVPSHWNCYRHHRPHTGHMTRKSVARSDTAGLRGCSKSTLAPKDS